MVETVQIRDIKPEERPMLRDFLYEAVFRAENQPPYPREIIEEPNVRVYIEGWGKSDDICLVAAAGDEIAGAVWTRILTGSCKGFGYVNNETPELAISLFKPFRGQGIGTMLMKAMIDRLKKAGYRKVSLSVTKDNPACGLYLKLGFQVLSENHEDYLMALDLTEPKTANQK